MPSTCCVGTSTARNYGAGEPTPPEVYTQTAQFEFMSKEWGQRNQCWICPSAREAAFNGWSRVPPENPGSVDTAWNFDGKWLAYLLSNVKETPEYRAGSYLQNNWLGFNWSWNDSPSQWGYAQLFRAEGEINVSFYDGHVEQVKLERLWQLSWHKDYEPPAKRPGL